MIKRLRSNYPVVYTAFDPYPSYKGSSIHIEKVSQVLQNQYGRMLLLTLKKQRRKRLASGIRHLQFQENETNFLKRAKAYSEWVDLALDKQFSLKVGHFRDIWGGLPLVNRPHITTVFEVNGLPSIELINRYPHLPQDMVTKLREMEDECLQKCHAIICPSETIKAHLIERHVLPDKITVITNGADEPKAYKKPGKLPEKYICYFGALQPWQGVDVLLKAMTYLEDKPHLKLVICSSHKPKLSRPFQKLARKLNVEERVIWKHKLKKKQLCQVLQHAICSVAPLTECSRNLEQGCSPLKIFESMACGTPVIASDLPVVREIIKPDVHAKLVRPDRPAELARAIRLLADYPEVGKELSANALKRFRNHYTWASVDSKLSEFYDKLVTLAYA